MSSDTLSITNTTREERMARLPARLLALDGSRAALRHALVAVRALDRGLSACADPALAAALRDARATLAGSASAEGVVLPPLVRRGKRVRASATRTVDPARGAT